MTDTITLTGLVATAPRHIVAGEGNLPITSFRLASTQRKFDRTTQTWLDTETNWYTITSFRNLATHVASSVERGHRVVVTGRLKMRDWEKDQRSGTTIEVVADALGHDLAWGTAVFTRAPSTGKASESGAAEPQPDEAAELPVPF
jgi:single-strand DNA-binding protein